MWLLFRIIRCTTKKLRVNWRSISTQVNNSIYYLLCNYDSPIIPLSLKGVATRSWNTFSMKIFTNHSKLINLARIILKLDLLWLCSRFHLLRNYIPHLILSAFVQRAWPQCVIWSTTHSTSDSSARCSRTRANQFDLILIKLEPKPLFLRKLSMRDCFTFCLHLDFCDSGGSFGWWLIGYGY